MGLYTVGQPDIEILTHSYSPLKEVNGFLQTGPKKTPCRPNLSADTIEFTSPSSTAKPGHVGATVIIPVLVSKPEGGGPTTRTVLRSDPQGPIEAGGKRYALASSPRQPAITGTPSGKTINPGFSKESFGAEDLFRGQFKDQGGKIFGGVEKSDDDPYYGAGSRELSGFFKKVAKSVKKAVHSPGRVLRKIAVINVGAASGGAAGFLTAGPAGIIPGIVGGTAKGFHDATKTGKPSLTTRSVFKTGYQSAAYGAGAALATKTALQARSAIVEGQKARSAAMAQKVGYGAARDTAMAAGTYTPVATPVPILQKFAAAVLKSPVTQATAAQLLLNQAAPGGQVPIEGSSGGGGTYTPGAPGTGGTYAPGFGPVTDGGYGGAYDSGGGGGGVPGEGLPEPGGPSFFSGPLPYILIGAPVAFFMLRKFKVG